eukprot:TRINITY_DN8445_c0_g1_i1.p1 TRINITY_DN8445_c0_g1~~TRINITY_DN8445_c0_g1_i1.p1  ORF type:complete len:428 (-),score=116.04 TRINITY_DN8445_c0_g1_i1:81-1364(-)
MSAVSEKVDVLLVGAGEYTTGFVHGAASSSDKKIGVVGLVMFDLRRRGFVDNIFIADVDGLRWEGIRQHFKEKIQNVYKDMDVSFTGYPADGVQQDFEAYIKAMDDMKSGGLVIIFTPDNTHFPIAKAAIDRKLHVLVAKPAVKTLEHHLELVKAAKEQNVLAAVEFHKRWDPCYADAKQRISKLGDFGFYSAFMSQPKSQLVTFKNWAGKASDISYYLNSHHIDFHAWALSGRARPIRVVGSAATGAAPKIVACPTCEDTITLTVEWENISTGTHGHAIYTSSWIAPKTDVHSQQQFYYMGHEGEVRIDQAHRGYFFSSDSDGLASVNPLYMKYTPDQHGRFAGQNGYGYQSIEAFVQAVLAVRANKLTVTEALRDLAGLDSTVAVTAILEGGRRSIDNGGRPFNIVYAKGDAISDTPVGLEPAFQ